MADPLDVLTLADAMLALGGLRSNEDRVAGYVTALSRRLDEACGPIVARTVTETHKNARLAPVFLNGRVFYTAGPPATAAPVVTQATWNQPAVTLTAGTDYIVDDDGLGGVVTKWSGQWGDRVTVVYTAGRFLDTPSVGEPFKTAAAMFLQHLWRRSDGGGSEQFGPPVGFTGSGLPSFGVPNVVLDLLTSELRAPVVA